MIKEYLEQYEEEDYEYPLFSTSSRFIRDYVDELFFPAYDEIIWHKSTSVVGQMFGGNISKKSFQYFMEYCASKKEIREVLCF